MPLETAAAPTFPPRNKGETPPVLLSIPAGRKPGVQQPALSENPGILPAKGSAVSQWLKQSAKRRRQTEHSNVPRTRRSPVARRHGVRRSIAVLSKIVTWRCGAAVADCCKTAWRHLPRNPQAALWLIAVLFTTLSGASLFYGATQSSRTTDTIETKTVTIPSKATDAEFPGRDVTATAPRALPNPKVQPVTAPTKLTGTVQPAAYHVPAPATRGAWLTGSILEEPTYTPPTARHDAPKSLAQ